MKIKLIKDSRDKKGYMFFGQATASELDQSVNFDDKNIPEKIQPPGNVECTIYTTTYIAQNKTKKEYDIDELFSRVEHNEFGANPRDVFKEIINNGFKVKGTDIYEKPFKSYWSAIEGDKDAFDNSRSLMLKARAPLAIATYWYREWLGLLPNQVMPEGITPMNGHMYASKGWDIGKITATIVNGEPMFIIEWWGGQTNLMPRKVFNKAMESWGCGAWILADVELDEKLRIGFLTKIKDACINVIIILKQLLNPDAPVEKPIEPKPTEVYNEVKETLMEKYDWSTQEKARHSVRVICDEEGLSVKDKNDLCGTVGGESGWNPRAIGKPNKNGSRDYGIVQLNDHFWIGEGKLYPNIEAVYNDPEGCIRWMCKQWKAGNKNWWYAYKNGSYRNYLYPVFDKDGKLQ